MTNLSAKGVSYPLLEALLHAKGLSLKGIYTIRDGASIFDVSARTIQEWVRESRLAARDLPGRGRFLSEDLERFLQGSLRQRPGLSSQQASPDAASENRGRSGLTPNGLRKRLS